ncbi:hypothetical protein DBV15_12592 [Temnothorax longispinosus]|uniref:Uncharacterized protein n=1 Tax=Temnothorax longispinosus TaxID=300112 RepID=A0A4S2KKJ3_9HYME|nr:hypothetical protein DBV15_12592 [Temnothorax longispinosus]
MKMYYINLTYISETYNFVLVPDYYLRRIRNTFLLQAIHIGSSYFCFCSTEQNTLGHMYCMCCNSMVQ